MGSGCLAKGRKKQTKIKVSQNQLNEYLDKFHQFRLIKLQNLFYQICQSHSKRKDAMNLQAFKILLKNIDTFSNKSFVNLFEQFDQQQQEYIQFRDFISKLSIILFGSLNIVQTLIFNIYDYDYRNIWRHIHFQKFCLENKKYLKNQIHWPQNTSFVTFQQFNTLINQQNFDLKSFRSLFDILTQSQDEKLIFQAISNRKIKFNKNQKVYIISYRWYQKWCLYLNHNNITQTPKKKQSKSNNKIFPNLQILQDVHILPQRPLTIQNQQLEGQFKGQLKPNIMMNYHYNIITSYQWNKLYSIYGCNNVFERYAVQDDLIQLYPKVIYIVNTDHKGRFLRSKKSDLKIIYAKTRVPLDQYLQNSNNDYTFYFKNLGNFQWKKVYDTTKNIIQLQMDSQCFIAKIQTKNEVQFLKANKREIINKNTITFGDLVSAIHLLDNDYKQVYIMDIFEDQVKIHYLHYPYTYDRILNINQLYFKKQQITHLPPLKKKKIFKGIANAGNTCFMNSIFQSILNINILTKYINNANQYRLIQKDKKQLTLTQCLKYIQNILLSNQYLNTSYIKRIIDLALPQFSGNQQHDAQQFLSILLDKLSEQLKIQIKQGEKLISKRNIINQLFQGSIQNIIICPSCNRQKNVIQNFYTLSLPLPEKSYQYFKITIFPHSFQKIENIYKIGFKLNKQSTVQQYLKQFAKTIGRSSQDYFLIQIDGSTMRRIIGTKSHQLKKLSQIFIRNQTNIYAFQKCKKTNIKKMHQNTQHGFQDPVLDQMVDYSREKDSWSFGKIVAIQEDKKTGMTFIKVKDGKNTFKVDYNRNKIAPFLSKCSSNSIIYIKTIHRKFNLGTRKIQVFGIPFISSIPQWATLFDIQNIIMKQIHMFIKTDLKLGHYSSQLNFQMKRSVNFHNKIQLQSSPSYSNLMNASLLSKQQSIIFQNEQNQQRKQIPFKLTIIDLQTQKICLLCKKQANSSFIKQNKQNICTCKIDPTTPLSWTFNLKECGISIDWQNLLIFNPNYGSYETHNSFTTIKQLQKNDVQNLKDCLNIFTTQQHVQNKCDNCQNKKCKLKTLILKQPSILIIHLKRFKYLNNYMSKIQNKIHFPFDLDIGSYTVLSQIGCNYELFAVTCHLGTGSQGHYISYVLKEHPIEKKQLWVLFDDDETSLVQVNKIFQVKAYILFYKKKNLPSSTYINYLMK